ncbi:serine hydrolase domain-containing protein [Christiangramia sp. ASW11-125]|uniref:serine hydrolase domain-containing protein n=1 Tax=Christiangramia sp. ASW11-125 TaxID=3400701 RepID=UPI003AAAA5DA
MKKIFKLLLYITLFIVVLSIGLYLTGYGYILRAVQTTYLNGHKTAFIDDHPYFENAIIENGEDIQEWPLAKDYNSIKATRSLDSLHKELETAAFLIIQNDSLVYEKYYQEYGAASQTNSFSMAKSVVSLLMYKAIQDGYLENIEQPVENFFPQFDKKLKIGDLSSMASGLNWDENYYNPFASTARAYFGKDIREQVLDLKVIKNPGEEFEYLSGNTQLLAMVIEKATGKTLSNYLSESFWKPMGMNDSALWQLDSKDSAMEKAYCCIATNARNFGKFGKFLLNNGNWNGEQLLDSAYIEQLSKPRFEDSPYYGYGFWLSDYKDKEIYYMRGILGQYVIVIPEDELVIVRLGEKLIRKDDDKHYEDFYRYIDDTYKMIGNRKQ